MTASSSFHREGTASVRIRKSFRWVQALPTTLKHWRRMEKIYSSSGPIPVAGGVAVPPTESAYGGSPLTTSFRDSRFFHTLPTKQKTGDGTANGAVEPSMLGPNPRWSPAFVPPLTTMEWTSKALPFLAGRAGLASAVQSSTGTRSSSASVRRLTISRERMRKKRILRPR